MNGYTLAHVVAGAAVGWLGLDWRYAVGAAIGSVVIEDAVRARLRLPGPGGESSNLESLIDVGAFLVGYALTIAKPRRTQ